MIKPIAPLSLFGTSLLLLSAGLSPVLAVSMDKSSSTKECAVMIGADAVQISAYQPDVSQDKYCEELPSTGKTIFVFDLSAPSMRDLPVEIRIVKDPMIPISASADLATLTEAYVAPKIYKNGTISVEHEFEESGHFIALVSLTEENGEKKTARFKFSVGRTFLHFGPLILGGVVIGAALFFYWRHAIRPSKSPN
jgi:hypothetical protein